MCTKRLGVALCLLFGCGADDGGEETADVGPATTMAGTSASGDDATTATDPTASSDSGLATTSASGTTGDGDTAGSATTATDADSGAVVPGYDPFYLADCDEGPLGARADGPDALASVVGANTPKVVYSDEQAVDGVGQSCRSSNTAGANFFGGEYVDLDTTVGDGDDVWMRHALYFPDGFCFGYGTEPGDGWGATKWMRIEFDNGGPQGAPGDRLTLQLGNMASSGCNAQTEVYGATREYAGAANLRPDGPTPIETGQWYMVQWHVHLAADDTGFVRFWVDDVFQGQVDAVTMSDPANAIDFIKYGDYWNGSPYEDIVWYLDEVIMTSDPPDTVDAGGRPYIAPTIRVDDFQ